MILFYATLRCCCYRRCRCLLLLLLRLRCCCCCCRFVRRCCFCCCCCCFFVAFVVVVAAAVSMELSYLSSLPFTPYVLLLLILLLVPYRGIDSNHSCFTDPSLVAAAISIPLLSIIYRTVTICRGIGIIDLIPL